MHAHITINLTVLSLVGINKSYKSRPSQSQWFLVCQRATLTFKFARTILFSAETINAVHLHNLISARLSCVQEHISGETPETNARQQRLRPLEAYFRTPVYGDTCCLVMRSVVRRGRRPLTWRGRHAADKPHKILKHEQGQKRNVRQSRWSHWYNNTGPTAAVPN